MIKIFWTYIGNSVKTLGGKISATRISSYLILGSILTTSAVYLGIDIFNAIQKWQKNEVYTIPTEHIFLFGMILAHHLTLLGINKTAETKQFANGLLKDQLNIDLQKANSTDANTNTNTNTNTNKNTNTNTNTNQQSEATSEEEEGDSSIGQN